MKKILIIEDEENLRNNIATYLIQENYSCEVADDYQSAISKISGFDYDCILLWVGLLIYLFSLEILRKKTGNFLISGE